MGIRGINKRIYFDLTDRVNRERVLFCFENYYYNYDNGFINLIF